MGQDHCLGGGDPAEDDSDPGTRSSRPGCPLGCESRTGARPSCTASPSGLGSRHLVTSSSYVCTCCLMATTTTVAVTPERRDPLFTELYSSRKLEKEISFSSQKRVSSLPETLKSGPDLAARGRSGPTDTGVSFNCEYDTRQYTCPTGYVLSSPPPRLLAGLVVISAKLDPNESILPNSLKPAPIALLNACALATWSFGYIPRLRGRRVGVRALGAVASPANFACENETSSSGLALRLSCSLAHSVARIVLSVL